MIPSRTSKSMVLPWRNTRFQRSIISLKVIKMTSKWTPNGLQMDPKAYLWTLKVPLRRPKVVPKCPQGTPRASQRSPKGAQGSPKGAQRLPKGTPKTPLGPPKTTKSPLLGTPLIFTSEIALFPRGDCDNCSRIAINTRE